MTDQNTGSEKPNMELSFHSSRNFNKMLANQKISLAFTTYQVGKVYFIGLGPDGNLSFYERSFDRSMGIAVKDNSIWMSSRFQLWRFENILQKGQLHDGYDALYLPLEGRTTGDIDIHDVGIMDDGRPVFVATRMNCLATLSDKFHIQPIWKPKFISKIAVEDRCHLNGMAMQDGKPAFATAVSTTDVADSWRDKKVGGGVLIDVRSDEVVCSGLSMPHSPRLHKGKLWLLNAGTGELGFVNQDKGTFEPVTFCPGFMRGMAILGDYAIVGLSKPRNSSTFEGLPLSERIEKEDINAKCGLRVIDLKSGDTVHSLEIEGVIEELYDVVALPGVVRPSAIGFKTDEIEHIISIAEPRSL